ncbi:DNA-binding protein [Mitsuaria sp. GD03876]|uniref:helix-turn-helix transcriptional regulator n=1 Tax=Mitsuaria sp. GD03876 TaxID=2975399 RepID=UPI00244A255F|nr:DNA-binding protein [Mitsuaria sp. GD03876]MDH0865960.1 DNA-binding protein [Mitsuaria sp. GD03876]
MEYVFTLKYQLPPQECEEEPLMQRLASVGCRDARVMVGLRGRLMLSFVRAAERAEQALLGGLRDVRRAMPGARLIEAGPDMVGLTDVATLVGVSRQNMRKLMLTHPMSFPSPIHEGNSSSVWHLWDVLHWMHGRGGYKIDQAVLELATVAKAVNLARDSRQLDDRRRDELVQLVA